MTQKYIIAISGYSGAGKDEIARILARNFQATHMGLVDSAKRHLAGLYNFSEQQVFGPSHYRNKGDLRYPKITGLEPVLCSIEPSNIIPGVRNGKLVNIIPEEKYWQFETESAVSYENPASYVINKDGTINTSRVKQYVVEGDPKYWLSPREALQKYCELMNDLYPYSWVSNAINTAVSVMNRSESYSRMHGPLDAGTNMPENGRSIVCFSDFRHKNEIKFLLENAQAFNYKPVLIRVTRASVPVPPFNHKSETEQALIKDTAFDWVISNNSSLLNLENNINSIMGEVLGKNWNPKPVNLSECFVEETNA